jgi:ERCC4-related helicase
MSADGAACASSTAPPVARPPPQQYDPSTIGRWVYPTNVSERSYQFEISSVAVKHNTLVCLPTGLGKTLIASVVMYNFYRWFPSGRCVFLAPTRPLVHQQVSAVRRVVGLPLREFAELTGSMRSDARQEAWRKARMLFLTPQTLQNDIESGVCPAHEVVCLVVDEAHRASGNHAYVKVVQLLMARSGGFRLLALSATPGESQDKLQELITALRIAKLEARDESSIDVMGCLN